MTYCHCLSSAIWSSWIAFTKWLTGTNYPKSSIFYCIKPRLPLRWEPLIHTFITQDYLQILERISKHCFKNYGFSSIYLGIPKLFIIWCSPLWLFICPLLFPKYCIIEFTNEFLLFVVARSKAIWIFSSEVVKLSGSQRFKQFVFLADQAFSCVILIWLPCNS